MRSMALFRRKFPNKVIVHSDRGSQYFSDKYQKLLSVNGLICSISAKGCCYDNAAMESFFHTLKVENWYTGENYRSKKEASSSIAYYIEAYYNLSTLTTPKIEFSAINYDKYLEFSIVTRETRS